MPITHTDREGTVTLTHSDCVVDVRKFFAKRNLSDTLDYSDFQTVEVTEALVYRGRTAVKWDYAVSQQVVVELEPINRFKWIDCSNLFTWRGTGVDNPRVDDIRHPDCVINYVEYLDAVEVEQQERAVKFAAQAELHAAQVELQELQRKLDADKERNRPVIGKQVVVVGGRKVKPGTLGTVAYVRNDGRVLLKDDAQWQDRKANGTWVDARHLQARP